jgi:RNA polymerase sigma-70 factor (ECF subfamily)
LDFVEDFCRVDSDMVVWQQIHSKGFLRTIWNWGELPLVGEVGKKELSAGFSMVSHLLHFIDSGCSTALLLLGEVLVYLDKERHSYQDLKSWRTVTRPAETTQVSSEALLLQRIEKRDPAAISELYDLHSAILYTVILRIVSNEAEAEDVLQEVFLRVWERAGTYNAELSAPLVWLTRVARNLAIDRLRSKTTRARSREDGLDTHPELRDTGDRSSPEQSTIRSQEQRAIASALATLSSEQRVLIECAYFQGYTQSELAALFKIPLGTVKTRIRSGMSSLRRQLQYLI